MPQPIFLSGLSVLLIIGVSVLRLQVLHSRQVEQLQSNVRQAQQEAVSQQVRAESLTRTIDDVLALGRATHDLLDDTSVTIRDSAHLEERGHSQPLSALEDVAETFYWVELNLQGLKLADPLERSVWHLMADATRNVGGVFEQRVNHIREQMEWGLQARSTICEIRQTVQEAASRMAEACERLERARDDRGENQSLK
ncbi:hypothetical protein TFLX_04004 [Thermoflexales bacterium]|nr:hypothetical protein TFLX_04004 [Thermoflexales bacterium]